MQNAFFVWGLSARARARARPSRARGASGPYPEGVSKDFSDRARVRFRWRGCWTLRDLRCKIVNFSRQQGGWIIEQKLRPHK